MTAPAAWRESAMVNTLVRPVISKIFMMRGSATTMCRSPPSFAAPLERAHQDAEGGGVEEGHPQQVEDDGRLTLGDDAVQALAQLRSSGDVDLPAHGDHRGRLRPPAPQSGTPGPLHPPASRRTSRVHPGNLQWRLAKAFYSPWTVNLNLRGFPVGAHTGRNPLHNPGERRNRSGPTRRGNSVSPTSPTAAVTGGENGARTRRRRPSGHASQPTAPTAPKPWRR